MTSTEIANHLCASNSRKEAAAILAPWHEETEFETKLVEAWLNVNDLRRQRQELIRIFPDRFELYYLQFDQAVLKIASDLDDDLRDGFEGC